ncbi:NUDIX domain-containing protein [Demequina lignilytica]|uniref:NUDIX hydrolase n=1 Tax=Demequina lignilytica TaxID=3051663 RepID=A0AB35MDZ8_9MICO|nr:NUDIX hydrolase [Demequina sp. SYSU T0a273]MDN4481979.1 NUDIX hydrolase [Demequina sp. SYSU T0a273]
MPFDPHAPRDPGDAWAEAPDGTRYWGRFGAAGLVAHDPDRGILLQHRALWSHHGGTWGIPGGARHAGEAAVPGALREAWEEASVPPGSLRVAATSTLELGFWSYTTVVARVTSPFEPHATDDESQDLAWIPVDQVASLDLHPGFGAAWPRLHGMLQLAPAVVVDAANVVGSVPDGWWRDRRGAAERLAGRVAAWAAEGIDAGALGLAEGRWFPPVELVVEGRARGARADGVDVHDAPGEGDDAVVARVEARHAAGERVTVVTSDRGLAARVGPFAEVRGARWLLDQLGPGEGEGHAPAE